MVSANNATMVMLTLICNYYLSFFCTIRYFLLSPGWILDQWLQPIECQSWQDHTSIDIQWLQPIECQSWYDRVRFGRI